ncbi:class I SAM-dependent methyltransferase [Candidatus Uabimicrobium amorphum]|uniref:Ubiquinone biosynthesis O-methyltransferase n=1 Tax=Uabimicrobium amorphum TaxID=2596890 RepID=A0A5S9IK84_UABAM|nr:methyltransferase domain-containing protein [Candidatus Uabimicrobium amorphum]BBM82125.1 Ubiquinone biosynthesis O-methyltransferase [Candidatus Uabimicrobium amorphum]
MMPDLPEIYNVDFFREWGKNNEKYVASASVIVKLLLQQFRPLSLVDIGCGCGVYSYFFLKNNVEVLSIDGVQPCIENSYPIEIQVQDLTTPFSNERGKFDVALCLEVAEHIPPEFVMTFLHNITQFSDTLLLSAAPPFQGGHHHVNEQPKRYWKQKLQQVGFAYNRKRTGKFVEAFKSIKAPHMWMGEGISVYERIQ